MLEYQKEVRQSSCNNILEELALEGFKEKLMEVLHSEIDEYLGRKKYERASSECKSYRNGSSKPRRISIGSGTTYIQAPRLREPFESEILRKYQSRSDQLTEMILDLYLHGLSTGDFSKFLDKILGEEASLSSTTITRLKENWRQEYEEWKQRSLEESYLYVWTDGVYPKAGPSDEKMALLVVIGVKSNGEKDILSLDEGYRESYESWKETRQWRVETIGLLIADGIKGLWKSFSEVYPKSKQQRCWVHKMLNILDKVPQHAQLEIREDLGEIYYSLTMLKLRQLKRNKVKSEELIKLFKEKYRLKYPKAVESLEEAEDRLLNYLSFPKGHWKSIKTTNPIESIFATVKLRIRLRRTARRIKTRQSAVYLIFKVLIESQKRWRRINNWRLVKVELEKLSNKTYVTALVDEVST